MTPASATTTYFGRYHQIHRWLIAHADQLTSKDHRKVSALIIGPGKTTTKTPSGEHRPCSYEPFEVANTLRTLGLDYSLRIVDRDESVLEAVRRTRLLWVSTEGFHGPIPQSYVDAFFPLNATRNKSRFVELPDEVLSRLTSTETFDISDISSPTDTLGQFTLVWCLNVLPNIRPQTPALLENGAGTLTNLVKEDGILVAEEIDALQQNPELWPLKTFFLGNHRLPVTIYKKQLAKD